MNKDIGKMLLALLFLLAVMFYVKISLGSKKLYEVPALEEPTSAPTEIPSPSPLPIPPLPETGNI